MAKARVLVSFPDGEDQFNPNDVIEATDSLIKKLKAAGHVDDDAKAVEYALSISNEVKPFKNNSAAASKAEIKKAEKLVEDAKAAFESATNDDEKAAAEKALVEATEALEALK